MSQNTFKPYHLNATQDDMQGNGEIGRYLFLPGSNGRAEEIASHFSNLRVKPHSRGHDLYFGDLIVDGEPIHVAAVSTGMGCASMEIILHELFHLGAKRFLRLGTAGSLQPNFVKLGDIIQVTGAVRDETSTDDYMPPAVPALASFEMNQSICDALLAMQPSRLVHQGIVHCKSTLYAREFGVGPRASENAHYLRLLSDSGVLASEMETASLFIQSMWYNHRLRERGTHAACRVLSGALLSIVAVPPDSWLEMDEQKKITDEMTLLGFEVIKQQVKRDKK